MKQPEEVHFEVSVTPEEGMRSVFRTEALPTPASVDRYRCPRERGEEVARKLQRHGVAVLQVGDFSLSASCPAARFEELFGTTLSERRPYADQPGLKGSDLAYLAPASGVPWAPPQLDGLDRLIERAYIQPPPVTLANEREIPPLWKDKFRLRVPVDVAQLMSASPVHRRGLTGKGVRVAMVDTGFYHHPYFQEQGYNFLAVTAPDAVDHTTDPSGHGTGECANLFATAPGINFIGVKWGANATLAFRTAVELAPDIITNSWLTAQEGTNPNSTMPNWAKPLYLLVLDAIARGITVCFAAGNGHRAFPGNVPEVLSVGGVHVTDRLQYEASDYTSGYSSVWFPGRQIPDVCGLVGMQPNADYIVLPVQHGAALEKANTGWGAFSGTSAATPMVAGVCALLKQADSSLSPEGIKNILKHTARDIVNGKNFQGAIARPGPDGAVGHGLADAQRAVEVIR